MANNTSGVQPQQQSQHFHHHHQQQQQQHQHQQQHHHHSAVTTPSPHHCKECGIYLNSAESLEVHLQYHKENLMKNWGAPASSAATQSSTEETNNNTTTASATSTNNSKQNNVVIKREFLTNSNTVAAAADSSDSMKKSPEYSRTTPETIFGHPPTPQSYQSAASSPYQNHTNDTNQSGFSPNFPNYQLKQERPTTPSANNYNQNYNNYNADQQFFNLDQQPQQYSNQSNTQDFSMHKNTAAIYRYHPYSPYDRSQSNSQVVSSSSPAYPPQPTPSPSPKQCDKCGYVCDSASQLIDHINLAHPPTPYHHSQQHFLFNNDVVKTEDDAQSEILDLDSHKVHQVYPEDEKRTNGDLNNSGHNPHPVSSLINTWSSPHHQQQQQQTKMFHHHHHQPFHPLQNQEFLPTTTSNQEAAAAAAAAAYRPFEHLPSQSSSNSVISSTQVPSNQQQNTVSPTTKSANWKSNEARRPKTYNCTACNKWFTSSGHLKRHYNTTLHKNAVKSSGQPDPAVLPISTHHHPAREPSSNNKDDHHSSSSPNDEDTNSMPPPQFERPTPISGLLQQPPNGPYDRQPPGPNLVVTHHGPAGATGTGPPPPPGMIGGGVSHLVSVNPNSSLTNLSNGSPPNGEAGLSPVTNLDSRGLLTTLNTTNSPSNNTHHHHQQHHHHHGGGFSMGPPPPPPHMMPIENTTQFQMYPNGSAPHVTQVTVISNPSITGEYHNQNTTDIIVAPITTVEQQQQQQQSQPLPSFAQFQAQRYGLLINYDNNANVGGGGPVTAPYSYYPDNFDIEPRALMYRTTDDEDYRLTVLTVAADPAPLPEEIIIPSYSPSTTILAINDHLMNNNTTDSLITTAEDPLAIISSQPCSPPEKAHIKRDFEEGTGSPQITSTSTLQTSSSNLLNIKKEVHRCDDCDKIFNRACYLTQHNKTFHSGDKPFKCSRCGKRFSSDPTYQEHLTKHAGDKPHKCDQCPKQFNHKTDLRRHMCLHTGQKPFACDTCGKGFIRKDHMLKHCDTHNRKNHHNKLASLVVH